jgi:hypothetical protein
MDLQLPGPTYLLQDDPRAAEPRADETAAVIQSTDAAALPPGYDTLRELYEGSAEGRADRLQAEIDLVNARRKAAAGEIAAGCTIVDFASERRRRGVI